jgi:hypothetical protein
MVESVLEVRSEAELFAALGPAGGRALILIGGADHTEPDRPAALEAFFATVARHCARTDTAVVDGGTDSGVMRLMGEARAASAGAFRLVGIVPTGAFTRPTAQGAAIAPAPHHSAIVRVPGAWFGDETRWLFAAADHLGGGSASTIVVNGGALTLDEAHQRLAAGHPVIAVEGSGRAADELAADPALRGSGKLRVMPLTVDDAELAAVLEA